MTMMIKMIRTDGLLHTPAHNFPRSIHYASCEQALLSILVTGQRLSLLPAPYWNFYLKRHLPARKAMLCLWQEKMKLALKRNLLKKVLFAVFYGVFRDHLNGYFSFNAIVNFHSDLIHAQFFDWRKV